MLEAYQKHTSAPRAPTPVVARERAARPRRDRPLRCARCGHRVTSEDDRIEVSGKHLHTCVNPHGILYHVACFRTAGGCRPIGERSSFWSWFPGFTWQIELCAACGEHLGWRFDGEDTSFHGLVVGRLVGEDEAGTG